MWLSSLAHPETQPSPFKAAVFARFAAETFILGFSIAVALLSRLSPFLHPRFEHETYLSAICLFPEKVRENSTQRREKLSPFSAVFFPPVKTQEPAMETELKSELLNYGDIGEDSPATGKKSKKKRKREEEKSVGVGEEQRIQVRSTAQQPVNGAAGAHKSMDVKIELIHDDNSKLAPIVGYFPSGYNPHKNRKFDDQGSKPYAAVASQPRIMLYRKGQRVKFGDKSDEKNEKRRTSERLELVVSPTGSKVDFVGKNYIGEAAAAQLCTYALGVLDKETQTLKILPVAANKIFRLEPKVRAPAHVSSDNEASALQNSELTEEQIVDKRKSLAAKRRETTLALGTKKAIIQDKKLNYLYQKDDPEAEKSLAGKIESVPMNEEALKSTSADVARHIPLHNTSATTPQEAYPLDKIIANGEWDFLEDVYHILHEGVKVETDAYPTFVCNRIGKLKKIQDEAEKKRLSGVVSYISHLIKFKDLNSAEFSSAKNHRFPSIVNQKFLEMFRPERKRLSAEKRSLLISYVLVLSLYADDFHTDPADLAKDLRMDLPELKRHYQNLGCKFVSQNKVMVATLPVPLQFPKLRLKRRR